MTFRISLIAALLPLSLAQTYGNASSNSSWIDLPGNLYTSPWGQCADATWPVTEIGSPIQPQAPDAELQEMLAEIDEARVEHIITTLANFGTRHTLSQQNSSTRGIGAARDWIYQQMLGFADQSEGRMSVYFNSYIQPTTPPAGRITFPVNITNVVAEIKGSTDPARTYVVTGHYDSRRIDILDYTGDAPGADDDASGVAVLMEMARVVAKRKPAATMIFAAVAGEEQGLYGSNNLAITLKNQSRNVEGNFNNDIVGTGKFLPFQPINDYTIRLFGASVIYPNSSSWSTAALLRTYGIYGGENDSPPKNLGRFIAEVVAGASQYIQMQVALIYRQDRFGRGGDQNSFQEQGFPAVRFTEAVEDFKHQHQDPRVENGTVYGDTIDFVDFDYTSRVARVNLASMWSAANAPGMPQNVTISLEVGFPAASEETPLEMISNDSQFSWNTGNDPMVASYELVYRTTGNAQWTHSVYAGDASTGSITVNLPKDDLQFGVRAIGVDGKKSPAVWPLPE